MIVRALCTCPMGDLHQVYEVECSECWCPVECHGWKPDPDFICDMCLDEPLPKPGD